MTLQLVFSQGGPWAIVAGCAYMLASGRWVPRALLRERDKLVDLAWRAFDREHAARELAEKQLAESMELGRTSAKLLTSVVETASVGASEGDGKDAPAVA